MGKYLKKLSILILIITVVVLSLNSSLKEVSAYILDSEETPLLARAGDGDTFGGGGYDSSSSWDSGSDWSSGSTFSSGDGYTPMGEGDWQSGCCFFAIVIIVILVYVIIQKKRKGPGTPTGSTPASGATSSGTGAGSNTSMSKAEIDAQMAKLKELDPEFDEQKFKTHAKKVFMAVQDGWTKRDQTVCRPFMAEEVFQSHQMQIDNLVKNKELNILENIVVGSMDFARIDLGDQYHKFAMKVRASMKDYRVKEDAPDVVIHGSKELNPPFTEYWVFIRKASIKTKIKDGIFDRKCPNCGAPIDVDVAGKCKYCNATVVNGDYDWVLSEIIQKSEWTE